MQKNLTKQFEFDFPHLDTSIVVEESEAEVIVRASRNTFSDRCKICFIHELAAEGFIPDSYESFSSFDGSDGLTVRWLVDYSRQRFNQVQAVRAREFMVRLLVFATILWLLMVAALFLT